MFLGNDKEGAAIEGHDLGYTPGLSSAKPGEPINSHAKIEKRSDSSDTFTFAADSTSNGQCVTVVKDDLFVGYSDRDRLINKLEGILLDCQHAGTKIKLAKCYDLCGLTYPEVVQSTKTEDFKRDFTPPESPKLEGASTKSNKSPAAEEPTTPTSRTKTKTSSRRAKLASDSDYDHDLSDPPSDLSDGKVKSVSFKCLEHGQKLYMLIGLLDTSIQNKIQNASRKHYRFSIQAQADYSWRGPGSRPQEYEEGISDTGAAQHAARGAEHT
jgi:hypothetical protein